jgi:hypothetical protein
MHSELEKILMGIFVAAVLAGFALANAAGCTMELAYMRKLIE